MNEVKTEKMKNIQDKLEQLTDEELIHADAFLDALFTQEKKPFDHYLGKFLEIDKKDSHYQMKLGKNTENTYQVAQGGAVFSLADIAIGFHLIEKLSKEVQVFTLELKMNFIKGGKGTYLYAHPNVIHLGGTTAVVECPVLDDQGEMVAQTLGTFYLKRK